MEREYVFGTTNRNGVAVETLKATGETHAELQCGAFSQIRREYPDCIITDRFRVDEQYESKESGGVCYDFYTISAHWRDVDKTPPVKTQVEDILLEMTADQEYRLSLLELGMTESEFAVN